MKSESLVSNKIPNINGTSFVVARSLFVGGRFAHASKTLLSELINTKFCFCNAKKIVTMSSLVASGLFTAISIAFNLNSCSVVNFVTGGGGPKDWFFFF